MQLGPGPQWCQLLQSQLERGVLTPRGVGGCWEPEPPQDLDAVVTVQGLARIRGDSPLATKTDGTWDPSSPLGTFCILY